jgi:hypothetical protein
MQAEDWFFLILLPILMDQMILLLLPTKLGRISDWFMSKMFFLKWELRFCNWESKDSFLEIKFKNPEETFDKVIIFNDEKMNGEKFQLFRENLSLSGFVNKNSKDKIIRLMKAKPSQK